MSDLMTVFEKKVIDYIEYQIPEFRVGDSLKVHQKIIEGNKERIQVFEGIVIAINNKGASKTFTLRRISYDVGVERVFPFYSPRIAKIELVRKGRVRRAKLYYLREKLGKSGRIKEKYFVAPSKNDTVVAAPVTNQEESQPAVESN